MMPLTWWRKEKASEQSWPSEDARSNLECYLIGSEPVWMIYYLTWWAKESLHLHFVSAQMNYKLYIHCFFACCSLGAGVFSVWGEFYMLSTGTHMISISLSPSPAPLTSCPLTLEFMTSLLPLLHTYMYADVYTDRNCWVHLVLFMFYMSNWLTNQDWITYWVAPSWRRLVVLSS